MKLMMGFLLLAVALGIPVSCSSGSSSFGSGSRTLGSPPPSSGGTTSANPQPVNYLLTSPAATNQYVFVANTTNNTVAKINKTTLFITSIPVGLMPAIVDVTPDNQTAAVFNSGDYSVSLIDISTDTVTTLPVDIYDNSMVLSPSGNVAITYFDPSKSLNLSANPTRNFNEIGIVSIPDKTSTLINVSFLPRTVVFTDDGSKAVVVTTSQIGVIDLKSGGYAVTRYQLVNPLLQQIIPSSLKLTPDGRYAITAVQNSSNVVIQDIINGSQTVLALGPTVTDVALTTDGTRAIAVNAGNGSLSYITLSTFSVTTQYTGLDINHIAISNDGTDALLYTSNPTTTTAAGETVYVLSLTASSIQSYPVVKGVSSVIMAPFTTTGISSAIIVHNGPGGSSTDPVKQFFYNNYAVTMFQMATGLETPVALVSAPTMFATSNDGMYGYAMMPDTGAIAILNLITQISTGIYVPSTPTFIGVMPGMHTAYIGETYPLGRLSFIEPDQNMNVSTITGFELGTH